MAAIVMTEMTQTAATAMAVMTVHYTCQVVQQTGQQHWAASQASTTGHHY